MGHKEGLPVPATGGDSVALRPVHRREPGTALGNGADDGNRRGVQRESLEQRPGGDDSPIAFSLLLAFTRHLIREQCGTDSLILAMHAAAHEQGVSKEEMQKFLRAVMAEHTAGGFWPKGF
jgi:hypothetical protein